MTAFLRRSDGALIVGATRGQAFISTDQGAHFAPWPNAPHLRALGERNGILYAVTDNYLDGYAVGRSINQGATWEGLIRFEQLTGPKSCGDLPTICAGPWQVLRQLLRIDGGSDGGVDAGTDGGTDAGTDADTDPNGPPANPRLSGCTESGEGVSWSVSAMILAIVAIRFFAGRSRAPR